MEKDTLLYLQDFISVDRFALQNLIEQQCKKIPAAIPKPLAGMVKMIFQTKGRQKIKIKNIKIANVTSGETSISVTEDRLDLLGNIYDEDFDSTLINKKIICSDFFDLKNGITEGILQKFSVYRVFLAIVSDFYIHK